MARFLGDDGPDVPADHLDPDTLQPVKPRPEGRPGPKVHPAERGVSAMDWLSVTDAARWLGVHPNTLKRWCEADEARLPGVAAQAPPFQRVGSRGDRRFRVNELERFVQNRLDASKGAPVATLPVRP